MKAKAELRLPEFCRGLLSILESFFCVIARSSQVDGSDLRPVA